MGSSSDIIKLNVGGKLFVTSQTTLGFDKNTFLWSMFRDGGLDSTKDENGYYFIDRDPTHFNLILNFMRYGGQLTLDHISPLDLELLEREADFYNIQQLIKILHCYKTTQNNSIKVDVGGTIFETTKKTLVKAGPQSVLYKMLTKEGAGLVKKVGDAYYFDRDAKCFGIILNFLRNDEIVTAVKEYPVPDLWFEAKYYRIPVLEEILENYNPKAYKNF